MTFEEAIKAPRKTAIILIECSAFEWLYHWNANGAGWERTAPKGNAGPMVALYKNGVALTKYASRALLGAGVGWVDETTSTGLIYLQLGAGVEPFNANLVQGERMFYFGNAPKVFNDRFYDPRVKSAPNISLRIERRFTGVPQVGGGDLELENNDGFFDRLDLQWDGGQTRMLLGVDVPGVPMPFASYRTIGTWRNESVKNKSNSRFALQLREPKQNLKKKIPIDFYNRAQYPFLRDQDVGKPYQIAYGTIRSAAPVCVHMVNKTFRLAGHAITAIDSVKVFNDTTKDYDVTAFANVNLAAATFDIPTWNGKAAVAVDFRGRKDAFGNLITNPADMIKDLLLLVGETAIDAASFTAARAFFVGGIEYPTLTQITFVEPWLYIAKEQEAVAAVSEILEAAEMYLFADGVGNYYLRKFKPLQGESLTSYTNAEILPGKIVIDEDRDQMYSRAQITFAERTVEGWVEGVNVERADTQRIANAPAPIVYSDRVALSRQIDAQAWAQRLLQYTKRPERRITITVPLFGMLTRPADQVRVVWERFGLDEVFEVVEQKIAIDSDQVTLTLGDRHGLRSSMGFWVGAGVTLPERFAGLAGYHAGAIRWHADSAPAIKNWKIQNCGFWLSARGFADDTDPDSFNVSTWL